MEPESSQSLPPIRGVSGLLLTGGESRRMGLDKARVLFCGEPLWKRQARTLLHAGASEVMISRGDRAPLGELGAGMVTVADAVVGCGPLGGITGGLRLMRGEWLMVLAVDLPLVHSRLLRLFVEQAISSGRGVVGKKDKGFEPLVA